MLNPFYCFKRGNKLRGEPICVLLSMVCVTVVSAQSGQYQTAGQTKTVQIYSEWWSHTYRVFQFNDPFH